MPSAKAFRNQVLDRLAEKLDLRVSKQFRRPRVRTPNYAGGIRDKNRVGRNIKKILQRGMSELGLFVLSRSRRVLFWGIGKAHTWLGP